MRCLCSSESAQSALVAESGEVVSFSFDDEPQSQPILYSKTCKFGQWIKGQEREVIGQTLGCPGTY